MNCLFRLIPISGAKPVSRMKVRDVPLIAQTK